MFSNHMNYNSLKEKVGQLFFIGIPGPNLDAQANQLLDDIKPGGICLFSRNIRDSTQTRELLDSITSKLPILPFLSLDQEGGLVDRLRRIMTPMPAAGKVTTVEQANDFASIVAESIRILGFNMNFAPVVDVIDESRSRFSNGLHSRAFGKSREQSVELADAFLAKLQGGGCVGCLKHFPGLGASEVDSHEDLPLVPIDEEEFDSVDLYPYKRLLSSGEVTTLMIAHAAYPALDLQETDQSGKLLPSSLSFKIVTTLLREQLGYDGLVLTDDLEMGAILKNYGIGEACVLAILAGGDMLSICAGVDAIYEGHRAVLEAIETGRISESRLDQSLKRIEAAKMKLSPPLPFDAKRLETLSKSIAELNGRLN